MRPGPFFLKLAALAAVVLAGQALIAPHLSKPPELASTLTDGFKEEARKPFDVLYVGDSVVMGWGTSSSTGLPLDDMLADALAPLRLVAMGHAGFHPGVFLAIARCVFRENPSVRAVLVPINLRAFGPRWDRHPYQQFKADIISLSWPPVLLRLFGRPLAVFKAFEPSGTASDAFSSLPVFFDGRLVGRAADFDVPFTAEPTPESLRKRIIFDYLQPVTPAHRKLAALRRLARLARRSGRRVVFYVTPVDVETFRRAVGPEADRQIDQNVEVIVSELRRTGCPVVDLSRFLPSEAFSWKEDRYPNEHLAPDGRRRVAAVLARAVRDALAPAATAPSGARRFGA